MEENRIDIDILSKYLKQKSCLKYIEESKTAIDMIYYDT